jgi:ligand-binding sensor domain-containing protein
VYVSLSGYRWDDFSSYLYSSDDYGQHWQRIGTDLPAEPINVVKEDPANPDLLYVGTDHNLYISLNRGNTFQTLNSNFPDVPVHDLAVQSTAKELVIGTHGRSMFKVSIELLQQLNADLMAENLHVFDISKLKFSKVWGKKQAYETLKDPLLAINYYALTTGMVHWSVKHKESGLLLNEGVQNCVRGINSYDFTLDVQESSLKKYKEILQAAQKDTKKTLLLDKADTGKTYLRKGVYTFVLMKEGKTVEKDFTIE